MGDATGVRAGAHHYRAVCTWSGSTAAGYEGYDRTHRVECPPAGTTLRLSSDVAFLGDPARLNPEQLLLAAAASCQLLSFLAVVARARLDVVAYADDAEADMPEEPEPMRITEIRLRPRIEIAGLLPGRESRVQRLVEIAHHECFIANSLACATDVRATIVAAPISS